MKRKIVKKTINKPVVKAKCYIGRGCGCESAVYGLGFIGSAVYYITTATGFWMGVLGVLKAIVWPAFLVFELLKYLGA